MPQPALPGGSGPFDLCTERSQVSDETVVAAIDVVRTNHGRCAVCPQAGDGERCCGPDVTPVHFAPAELSDAADHDVLAVGVMLDDMAEENGPLMIFPGTHKGPIHNHHVNDVFAGAMDLSAAGLNPKDAMTLTGAAGSISIHHARVVHGSALNRSARDRRLLFYEMMSADAFPVMGAMTTFDGIGEYNDRMLCGDTTLEPRLERVPVRIPQPQPGEYGSIYEIQKALGNRGFETYKEEDA